MDASEHLERAARHRETGVKLAADEDEWAVVCYFYAAVHHVHHALLTDPIFDNPTALSRIDPELTMADRDVTRHTSRPRTGPNKPKLWGRSDLVLRLYHEIYRDYELLYSASISVRYHDGISTSDLPTYLEALDRIAALDTGGHLRAWMPTPPGA